jgi:hypothetical protein
MNQTYLEMSDLANAQLVKVQGASLDLMIYSTVLRRPIVIPW